MKDDKQKSAYKFAKPLLEDPQYRATLKARLNSGIIAPGLERILWFYVYGRPIEKVEVDDARQNRYAGMNESQLAERAKELADLAAVLAGMPTTAKNKSEAMN